ncbi:GM10672 [Drosophila sechellia]|uniref:GM10672 n=1 Tax=Drosophila sechellia TaxID=7238 RepID=B4I3U2_DROSE|nr:GM10672 [Drosophila sechellia]
MTVTAKAMAMHDDDDARLAPMALPQPIDPAIGSATTCSSWPTVKLSVCPDKSRVESRALGIWRESGSSAQSSDPVQSCCSNTMAMTMRKYNFTTVCTCPKRNEAHHRGETASGEMSEEFVQTQ